MPKFAFGLRPVPALEPLVVAADSPELRPACNVLMLHDRDLRWHGDNDAHYLVRWDEGPGFAAAREATASRAGLGIAAFRRRHDGAFRDAMAQAIARFVDGARGGEDALRETVAATFGADRAEAAIRGWVARTIDNVPHGNDFVAALLLLACDELGAKQRACSGLSEAQYRATVDAALRSGGTLEPVARVAYAPGAIHPEVAFASPGGAFATVAPPGSTTVSLFRLSEALSALKRGEDRLLPAFIAAYLNGRGTLTEPARACARTGGPDDAEFDLVVPALKLAMEVKVYQSPAATTDEKARSAGGDLRPQLRRYFEAGFEQVFFVTNLPDHLAEVALDAAAPDAGWPGGRQPVAFGGLEELLGLLDDIEEAIDARSLKTHVARLQAAIAPLAVAPGDGRLAAVPAPPPPGEPAAPPGSNGQPG